MNRYQRYYEKQMQDEKMKGLIEKEIANLDIGIRLARLRAEQHLNQTQLAARAGMNASKISKIESSPANLTLNTLTRLAEALGAIVKIEFVPKKNKTRELQVAEI
jgi:transcriptional regulator with XRE-family HTH domain